MQIKTMLVMCDHHVLSSNYKENFKRKMGKIPKYYCHSTPCVQTLWHWSVFSWEIAHYFLTAQIDFYDLQMLSRGL